MRNVWKWSIGTLVTAALLLAFSPVRAADDAAEKGKVSGVVMKAGKAVADVQVRLIKPRPRQGPPPGQQPGQQAEPPGGQPPPGGPGAGPGGGNRPAPIATATTDANGKFTMENVPPGEYMVVAGSRQAGMGRTQVTVEAGKTANVTIELQDRPAGGRGPGGGQRPPQAPPQN